MEAEQEELLVQRLKEGVEVNGLLPHMFHEGFVFYEIHVQASRKIFAIQIKTKKHDKSNLMEISRVYAFVAGQKTEINTKLIHKYVKLVPFKNLVFAAQSDNLYLDGNFFLQ